jgi:Na+-transporting methylmalonyl-CoA/oxaloacetate decarboxylase gamma subunit
MKARVNDRLFEAAAYLTFIGIVAAVLFYLAYLEYQIIETL